MKVDNRLMHQPPNTEKNKKKMIIFEIKLIFFFDLQNKQTIKPMEMEINNQTLHSRKLNREWRMIAS